MGFTQKIICEPLNCGVFFKEKVNVRLNNNGHEISIKQHTKEYKHLRSKVHATIRKSKLICNLNIC